MTNERTAAQPAAPSPTQCPWTDAVVGNLIRENVGDTFMEEYANRMRVHARSLERLVHQQQEALREASEATGYESHDDSVGYRVCCQVRSFKPHTKSCRLNNTLAAYAALKKEIERG